MPSKNFLLFVLGQVLIVITWIGLGKVAQFYMADAHFAYIFLVGGLVGIVLTDLSIVLGLLLFPMKFNK